MLRVVGYTQSPINEPIPYTSLLVQCIAGSDEVLLNSYVRIQLDETGHYDFSLLNATYRIYANYANGKKIDILGDCTVADGMPKELTINNLVSNFTPVPPSWVEDLDNKWKSQWDKFINDSNTAITSINRTITDGDARVVNDMSTYINKVTGELGSSLSNEVKARSAEVTNQMKAYTNDLGAELATNVLQVRNSVSAVTQTLDAYKNEAGDQFASIKNNIDINQAKLGSQISAEVDSKTGAMELRLNNVIETNTGSISEDMSLIRDDLGKQTAAWQVVAKVDDLSSSVGMTNDGTNSRIYMQAESLILTNDNNKIVTSSAPFYIEGGKVYMRDAYIKELSGDKIKASSSVIVGSGNTQAGMSGKNEGVYKGWRFWAGHADPSKANFSVDENGKLGVVGARISGDIYAKSLTFINADEIPDEINNAKITSVKTYSQDSKPIGKLETGSIWYDTANKNKPYRYNGKDWLAVQDGGITDAHSEIAVAKSEIATTKSEIESTQSELESAKTEIKTAQSGIATAHSEIAGTKSEIATTKTDIASAKSEIAGAQSDITAAKSEIDDAKSDIKTAKSDIATVQSTANTSIKRLDNLYPNQSKIQISSGKYVKGSKGWAIDSDGRCEFNTGVFRGTLEGVDGIFRGTIFASEIEGDVVGYRLYNVKTYDHQLTDMGAYDLMTINVLTDSSRTRIGQLELGGIKISGASQHTTRHIPSYLRIMDGDTQVWRSDEFLIISTDTASAVAIDQSTWFTVSNKSTTVKLQLYILRNSSTRFTVTADKKCLFTITQESTELG